MTEPAPDAREIARKWRIVRDSNSYAYVDRQTVGWNIVASPMNEHNALADAYIALLARVERLERERTEARLEAESFRYIVIEWRGMYDAAITEAAAQRARADAAQALARLWKIGDDAWLIRHRCPKRLVR